MAALDTDTAVELDREIPIVAKRGRGLGVVFVSHSMPHVIQVADEVQVMRLGRRVATYKAKETTMEELVGAMTGAASAGAGEGAGGNLRVEPEAACVRYTDVCAGL